ncbi:hypothetical protein [Candidatus Ferrigenium straubiae]|jgi:hypothetical protein|uniref:hypothetical protein n=1 Tax=Candidatus Ferrigenium straubiae TaxID=2919506 RepID=UPI003F4AF467
MKPPTLSIQNSTKITPEVIAAEPPALSGYSTFFGVAFAIIFAPAADATGKARP